MDRATLAQLLYAELVAVARRRTTLAAQLVAIVVRIVREELLQETSFDTLRDMLKTTDVSHSLAWELVALGEYIVPYADARHIDIDPYLTAVLWTKTREALPALRHAVKANRVTRFRQILRTVKSLPDRDAVRSLYRVSRNDQRASTLRTPSGYTIVVVKNGQVREPSAELAHVLAEAIQILTGGQ